MRPGGRDDDDDDDDDDDADRMPATAFMLVARSVRESSPNAIAY